MQYSRAFSDEVARNLVVQAGRGHSLEDKIQSVRGSHAFTDQVGILGRVGEEARYHFRSLL